MSDRFIETHVRQLPLFAPLPEELLQQTLSAMQIIRYEAGETVFHQGETSKGMYLLISGRADLIRQDDDGNDVRVGRLEPNQFINEKSLYQKGRETATLVVRVTSSFLVISRNQLWDVVANYPQIKQYIPVPVEAKPEKPKPTSAPTINTPPQQTQQPRPSPRPQPTNTPAPITPSTVSTERAEFDGQRKNELVLLKTRRHWWSFIQKGWFPAMLFGTGLMVWAFVPIPFVQIIACGFVGLFIPAVLMLYHIVEWRNDMLIITNQRVIYLERKLFSLSSHKTEIVLSRIHQVNVEINPKDPMARLFRYGSIQLRTAGDAGNIYLHTIQNVNEVQEVIFENRAKIADTNTDSDRDQIRTDIERVLAGEDITESDGKNQTITPPPKIFAPLRSKFINADGDTVYRRHPIAWWRKMIRPALLIIGAFAVLIFGATWGLGAFSGVIGIGLFFGALLWAWWIDWDWRNDLYIIGDSRVKLIRKRPLWLQNKDDHILMESIDNVTSEKGGILQNIFNYGDVRISLIGGDRGDEKWLLSVPNPQSIQAEITKRQERRRNAERDTAEKRRKKEIAEYISVYHEMQQNQGFQGGASFPTPPRNDGNFKSQTSSSRPPNTPRKKN